MAHIYHALQLLDATPGQVIYRVRLSSNVYNVTVIPLEYLYPLPNPAIHSWLVRKVTERIVVCLYGKVVPYKIMSPLTNCPDNAQQLPFVCTVPTFGRVELSAVLADRLQALTEVLLQDCSN